MTIDVESVQKLVTTLLALVATPLINRALAQRPRLVWFPVHAEAFHVPPQAGNVGGTIHTHSIVVRNAGNKTCENVRIGHHETPMLHQLYPNVPHAFTRDSNGGPSSEIAIAKLVPQEQITIAYLYFPPLIWDRVHSYIKSDDGFAQRLDLLPSPPPSRLRFWINRVLRWVGIFAISYAVIAAAAYVWF
jgi:hypothetical protein